MERDRQAQQTASFGLHIRMQGGPQAFINHTCVPWVYMHRKMKARQKVVAREIGTFEYQCSDGSNGGKRDSNRWETDTGMGRRKRHQSAALVQQDGSIWTFEDTLS